MKVSNYTPDSHILLKPISFIINMNGKELSANIIEIVDNPMLNEFVIKFSDGYQDSFVMTEDGYVAAGNKESGKRYAAAVKEDMDLLGLLTNKELVWNIRYPIDDKLTNVWIRRQKRDEGTKYAVYYQGDYHFHVKQEEDKWISETSRKIDPQPIDDDLAKEVIKLVVKEHLIIPFDMV
ncbi:MAG TPA: hypothetical protein VK588_07630 [Chitinophagaceae bacterium]|nr:hypothetical protein [Chitinophagaceae bacterium]